MTEPDPVALAVEAALTPSLAEAAAEVDSFLRVRSPQAPDVVERIWADRGYPLRASALRVLTEHAYATGTPCDGERCENGGAAHCHRCAEVDADNLVKERDRLRAEIAELRGQSTAPRAADWAAGRCVRCASELEAETQ